MEGLHKTFGFERWFLTGQWYMIYPNALSTTILDFNLIDVHTDTFAYPWFINMDFTWSSSYQWNRSKIKSLSTFFSNKSLNLPSETFLFWLKSELALCADVIADGEGKNRNEFGSRNFNQTCLEFSNVSVFENTRIYIMIVCQPRPRYLIIKTDHWKERRKKIFIN